MLLPPNAVRVLAQIEISRLSHQRTRMLDFFAGEIFCKFDKNISAGFDRIPFFFQIMFSSDSRRGESGIKHSGLFFSVFASPPIASAHPIPSWTIIPAL